MKFCWSDVYWTKKHLFHCQINPEVPTVPILFYRPSEHPFLTIQVSAITSPEIFSKHPKFAEGWGWLIHVKDAPKGFQFGDRLPTEIMASLPIRPAEYPPFLSIIGTVPAEFPLSVEVYFRDGHIEKKSIPAGSLVGSFITGREGSPQSFRAVFSSRVGEVYVFTQV